MEKKNLNTLIGENLRTLREKKGVSLEKAAQLTGVSKPMLGQIERGVSNPTVSTLWKIASGLGVPFTTFLDEKQPEVKIIQKYDTEPLIEADGKFHVYPVFPMERGKPFEIFTIELLEGCDYPSQPHPRGVEEYIWIEEGTLNLQIEQQSYTLYKEQGIRFSADYYHSYANHQQTPCRATMVIYYPAS